jgi:hypothetical protein
MNRTRATFLLAAVALMSLGATGCHRHRIARGVYPTNAYQPVMYQRMAAPQPIVIVVETRGQAAPVEVVDNEDNSVQEAAVREATAREEARRQAQIERERARIEREQERARREQERARREQEQAQRDAQARAAAQRGTTIIVLSPGQKPVQVDGSWFQGQ